MISPCRPMATVPPPWPIWILTFVVKNLPATPFIPRLASPATYLASMVMSPGTLSTLRTSHPSTTEQDHAIDDHGSFLDLYLSTHQGPASFFGNRSVVFHTSNATRLTCANFTLTSGNSTSSNGTSSSGNGTVVGSTPPAPFTGGAATAFVSIGAIVAGLAVFLL